jgi:hypothetical protein
MIHVARILLLVSLLLPVRGAMAAAGLFCHEAPPPAQSGSPSNDRHHHTVSESLAGASVGTSDVAIVAPAGGDSVQHEETVPASSTCDLCSSICACPPIPSSAMLVVSLPRAAALAFPALAPPASTLSLGGLERPPRVA